jgi:hypothetical protein
LSNSGTTPTSTNQTGITWTTSGDGVFNDATLLTPIYTPGANDIANGTVDLTITATGNAPCANAVNAMTVTINAKPNTSVIFHN